MKYTGVKATPEQVKNIRDTAALPVMKIGDYAPPTPQQITHDYALIQGLPEIEGYYGIDLTTGEFVSA